MKSIVTFLTVLVFALVTGTVFADESFQANCNHNDVNIQFTADTFRWESACYGWSGQKSVKFHAGEDVPASGSQYNSETRNVLIQKLPLSTSFFSDADLAALKKGDTVVAKAQCGYTVSVPNGAKTDGYHITIYSNRPDCADAPRSLTQDGNNLVIEVDGMTLKVSFCFTLCLFVARATNRHRDFFVHFYYNKSNA